MILLKTQPQATTSEMPSMAESSVRQLIAPFEARKNPPAVVIRLPKIIPGLVILKKFLIECGMGKFLLLVIKNLMMNR